MKNFRARESKFCEYPITNYWLIFNLIYAGMAFDKLISWISNWVLVSKKYILKKA